MTCRVARSASCILMLASLLLQGSCGEATGSDAARAGFSEQRLGSLATDKLADFVILGTDIIRVNPLRIREARVIATVVGGHVVYSSAEP